MRATIIANIHELEGTEFVAARLIDSSGKDTLDEIVRVIDVNRTVAKTLIDVLFSYDLMDAEVWTSTPAVYTACLSEVGLAAVIKRSQDTRDTRRLVDANRDDLIDLYEIRKQETTEPEPIRLPKWKAVVVQVLQTIITKLGGDKELIDQSSLS